MKRSIAFAAVLGALTLGGCAQQGARPEPAAAAPAAGLSPQDRVAFFVNHARQGKVDDLKQDLDAGIDVNGRDSLDQTALLAAVSHNELGEVQLLLGHGADPNLADNAGWTSLHYAAYFGSGTGIIAALLDHGAAIDRRNDRGITPLYFASATGHDAQVKLLLGRGADRSIASKAGYTALRVAQVKGFYTTAALIDPAAAKAAPTGGAAAGSR